MPVVINLETLFQWQYRLHMFCLFQLLACVLLVMIFQIGEKIECQVVGLADFV